MEVVTVIGPGVRVPPGTVAVIWEKELMMKLAFSPLKVTLVTSLKPLPLMITGSPIATTLGAKLVIDGTQTMSTPGGDFTIQRKDVYSVAANVLTIERTTTTQQGTQTRKLVYNKAP